MARFHFLNKLDFELLSKDIFSILAFNMSAIAPTGNTFDEDYQIWLASMKEELLKEQKQLILIYSTDELIGFFQYSVNFNVFMMEEIQIRCDWQGKEIFKSLYGFLISNLPKNIQIVEAYAHKKNSKSQGILEHLGLKICGENKNGSSYHFRGKYDDLLAWYYSQNFR